MPDATPSCGQQRPRGRRLRAECGHDTAVLRSGQSWQDARDEQLADYHEQLQPPLMRGRQHLQR